MCCSGWRFHVASACCDVGAPRRYVAVVTYSAGEEWARGDEVFEEQVWDEEEQAWDEADGVEDPNGVCNAGAQALPDDGDALASTAQ